MDGVAGKLISGGKYIRLNQTQINVQMGSLGGFGAFKDAIVNEQNNRVSSKNKIRVG